MVRQFLSTILLGFSLSETDMAMMFMMVLMVMMVMMVILYNIRQKPSNSSMPRDSISAIFPKFQAKPWTFDYQLYF